MISEGLEPITVSVLAASELLGISRATLYPLVMAGIIPNLTVGRRRLVLVDGLRAWAAMQAGGNQSDEVA